MREAPSDDQASPAAPYSIAMIARHHFFAYNWMLEVETGIFGGEDEIRTILVDSSRVADLLDFCVRGVSRGQRRDPSASAFCSDFSRGTFPLCWQENGVVGSFAAAGH
ncbi:MAG: hypothetical protein WAN03_18210 [Candidatus Sulfotelmatobacter sp.]